MGNGDMIQPLRDAGWRVMWQCGTHETTAKFEKDWREFRVSIGVEIGDIVNKKISAEQVRQCIAWLDAYQVATE